MSLSLAASTGCTGCELVRSFTPMNSLPFISTIMASSLPSGEMATERNCAPSKNASSGGGAAEAAAAINASNRIANFTMPSLTANYRERRWCPVDTAGVQ